MAKQTRASANILPYIIVFAILFFVMLVALSWTLSIWSKSNQCAGYPNIWCADDWVCNTSCPTGYTGNSCFVENSATGLASCLMGPDSAQATLCFNFATGTTGALACECTNAMSDTQNCFSGCPQTLSDINNSSPNFTCCCNDKASPDNPNPRCTPDQPACKQTKPP